LKDVRKLQKAVIAALEDIKAADIQAFDVTHITAMFDRVVLASAQSSRQLKALSRNVQDKAREMGWRVSGIEGEDGGEWVLVDLGDMIVHIMQPAVRAHYNLEELWGQPKPRAPRKPAAAGPHAPATASAAARPARAARKRAGTTSAG
jgi:ribosome-associated protein